MLALTHAAIGGAIGETIPSPWLAFGIGMISHILLDKIPHFFSFKKPLKDIIIWGDAVATTLFLILLFFMPSHNHLGLIFGALGGVVIDLTLVILFKEKGRLAVWHTNRQIHKASYLWLLTDVVLFGIGLAAILMAL
jgi:hypothetical protein